MEKLKTCNCKDISEEEKLGLIEEVINDYKDIDDAGQFIGWVHLNDCSGLSAENEGLSLFDKGSIVDWPRLIAILKKINAPMILEIAGAEKDYGCIEKSLINIKRLWDITG
mgnify:CR=1 FL=1